MSETTVPPSSAPETPAAPAAPASAPAAPEAPAPAADAATAEAEPREKAELSIRSLLEAGVHFGHQTRRWNPRMRPYLFGERNKTHIIDLDQTFVLFEEALAFLRDTVASGGKVLFVGTKRQAAPVVMAEARRSRQYYVNNRWLGGMLTNWKTVKRSIERYKGALEILGDEEKQEALSKKELARVNRQAEKYAKSLEGIIEMSRLPDALFVLDVGKEEIAVGEARRLGIPVVAVVDSNCSPVGIDYVVPGNDDAIRALDLYCQLVADACLDGDAQHQKRLATEPAEAGAEAAPSEAAPTGRRVVEIKQPPRRGRGQGGGRTVSSGGWAERREESGGEGAAPAPAAPATGDDGASGS